MGPESGSPGTTGRVIHWAGFYDGLVKFLMMGKEAEIRRASIELAGLRQGERILDIGCGTGSLTLEAKKEVGLSGEVYGVDPAAEMIAVASRKAAVRGEDIKFQAGMIEAIPFPDGTFDAVLSSLMVHHLPDDLKERGFAEVYRVLKPGGRLLIVDIEPSGLPFLGALFTHLIGHGRMRGNITRLPGMLREAGFDEVKVGRTPFSPLSFALAAKGVA